MLRAVFARTPEPGVSFEQFGDAWVSEVSSAAGPPDDSAL